MTLWSDTMLHDKYMKNGPQAGTGFILPKSGKTLQWWLGAGLIYAGLGAPGAGKVIREIAAIIDKPQYFAKVAAMGVGGVLVLSASS
jgi:hypothetical protein